MNGLSGAEVISLQKNSNISGRADVEMVMIDLQVRNLRLGAA